jgi:hypothetical protein
MEKEAYAKDSGVSKRVRTGRNEVWKMTAKDSGVREAVRKSSQVYG